MARARRTRELIGAHFPENIDPDSAKAEYRNGMLRLTAAIAKAATAQKVEIKAA